MIVCIFHPVIGYFIRLVSNTETDKQYTAGQTAAIKLKLVCITEYSKRVFVILYTGKIWQGNILANHTGKSYWWGKVEE